MSITADLSRSDLLLLCPAHGECLRCSPGPAPLHCLALPQPAGRADPQRQPITRRLQDAWHARRHVRVHRELLPSRRACDPGCLPDIRASGRLIALFSIEISQIQLERHRTARQVFPASHRAAQAQCMRGELADTRRALTPFTEWDGVLLVDPQRRITYLSGIANNLYRRLGYLEDLREQAALLPEYHRRPDGGGRAQQPASRSSRGSGGTALLGAQSAAGVVPPAPLRRVGSLLRQACADRQISGVLIMVHDATEERRKKQELKVKSTMIQEVHHRVKNNLQTVAAMLRMQARRTQDPEALQAINEAIYPHSQRGGDPRVSVAHRGPVDQHPRRLPAHRQPEQPGGRGAGDADQLRSGRSEHLLAQPAGHGLRAGRQRADPECSWSTASRTRSRAR